MFCAVSICPSLKALFCGTMGSSASFAMRAPFYLLSRCMVTSSAKGTRGKQGRQKLVTLPSVIDREDLGFSFVCQYLDIS